MKDVYTYLADQFSFTQYLAGGFHFGGDIPYVSRQYLPDSFNDGKLLDCGFFQPNVATPTTPAMPHSVENNFSIFLYSVTNSDAIEPARAELYDLLHYREIPTTEYAWQVEFVSETQSWWDDHLSAWAHICRYRWLTNRR